MDHPSPGSPPPFWKSSAGFALVVAVVVGGYYLVTEHRAHLYGFLPFLLLLACPVMHLFMHRGHGHGHGSHKQGPSKSTHRSLRDE